MERLYLEDLTPGQVFTSKSVTVTEAEIKAFAGQYDPQPFHLDDEAAKKTLFGGLAASGWHTAALTMRLLVDGATLSRFITAARPELGIIAMSGISSRWTKEAPRDFASAFISKPFTAAGLLSQVEKLIHGNPPGGTAKS